MKSKLIVIAALAASSTAYAGTSHVMFAYSNNSASLPTLELTYSDASTASVTASLASWYRSDGLPGGGNNWIAGVCGSSDICFGDNLNYRSAFVFSIPDASILVTGAYIQSFVQDPPYRATSARTPRASTFSTK